VIVNYRGFEDVAARCGRVPAHSRAIFAGAGGCGAGALVYDVAQKLRSEGYTINPRLRSQGDIEAVMIEEGTGWKLGWWSDGQRGERAVGY
jgi:hypothetical protein